MSNRVMFVDDDRLLLNSIVRNLGFDFDISVAENGPEAIDLLTTDPRYTVIVTDMRMPGMDGIQFIEAARPLAPEAVFVMLTGNQDLNTAIQAVNDGQVFRFLNKPCEMAVIKQAIVAGQRQHELQRSEKDLLNKTCAGAISMLTDVLAASHSEHFSRIELYGRSLDAIRQSVGIADRWEYRLASKLALVGFACLRPEDIKKFLELPPDNLSGSPCMNAPLKSEAAFCIGFPDWRPWRRLSNFTQIPRANIAIPIPRRIGRSPKQGQPCCRLLSSGMR